MGFSKREWLAVTGVRLLVTPRRSFHTFTGNNTIIREGGACDNSRMCMSAGTGSRRGGDSNNKSSDAAAAAVTDHHSSLLAAVVDH